VFAVFELLGERRAVEVSARSIRYKLSDIEVASDSRADSLKTCNFEWGREHDSQSEPKEELQMSQTSFFREMWSNDEGQDIAEYAVMLAVILVIVVGTIRLIGGNANNVFSSVASSIGQ
jgi:Flp pilus assembly pilin Flp